MALSGIEWNMMNVFDTELRTLRANTPLKEERSSEEQAIIDYLKSRIQELEDKRNTPLT